MYTPMGQIRAVGFVLRRLKDDDPRSRKYRRTIARQGWYFLWAAVLILAMAIVVSLLF
ncbi:MAG: hypothetical protein HY826_14660 [Actinobacteria bacterium]|nr:hypothetical protein [Actinomycetota bacterium]